MMSAMLVMTMIVVSTFEDIVLAIVTVTMVIVAHLRVGADGADGDDVDFCA